MSKKGGLYVDPEKEFFLKIILREIDYVQKIFNIQFKENRSWDNEDKKNFLKYIKEVLSKGEGYYVNCPNYKRPELKKIVQTEDFIKAQKDFNVDIIGELSDDEYSDSDIEFE